MYRRLKNILGVSLMVLAVVISQLPMPEAQAEITKGITAQDTGVDDISAHTVTFSMNGGSFSGSYNNYTFKDQTPVLVIDDGGVINSFPDDRYASYTGYSTEKGVWYTDNECLNEYSKDSQVTKSITLYKKWYNVTSDGSTPANKGFYISPDGRILYKYDGDEKHVEIPETVTKIVEGAFGNLDNVRGITLPANIEEIEANAFSGLKDGEIIYVFDSGTDSSKKYGKQLGDAYEQLVYSQYLDIETVGEITGIDYPDSEPEKITDTDYSDSELKRTTMAKVRMATEATLAKDGSDPEENPEEESPATDESSPNESLPNESSPQESSDPEEGSTEKDSGTDESPTQESPGPEESSDPEESSEPIVIDPDKKYTVTFDTGEAPDMKVEKQEVSVGGKASESVSVNGSRPEILKKDTYRIKKDDGKQEITYIFKGWYKDKDYKEEWDFTDTIEEDTTIYAKWDKQTRAYYSVTFSAAGAGNVPEKQKLYEDENLEKPSKIPTMENQTFKGWYTDAANASTEFKDWGKPVSRDMTLYARFEEDTYTVVFHMNGGGFTGNYNGTSYTDAASLTAKVTVGQGIVYPPESGFKYSNYTTDSKWYRDKECLEVYNDTALRGDLTLYKKWYYISSGFSMNTAGNILYSYSGNDADITIPATVTVIAENAFSSMGSISGILLPDNISDVKPNAFSGANNISRDITITGKTEKARNIAKGLANQYTHLVYEAPPEDDVQVVSLAESGSILLGARIAGSIGTVGNGSPIVTDTAFATGSITLGAAGSDPVSASSPAQTDKSAEQGTTAPQGTAVTQTSPASASAGSASGSPAVTAKTTKRQNVTSASAPRGTEHIKDSTPKTGDPLQYRMLSACAVFSIGALLVLTGNGKKKRFSAS